MPNRWRRQGASGWCHGEPGRKRRRNAASARIVDAPRPIAGASGSVRSRVGEAHGRHHVVQEHRRHQAAGHGEQRRDADPHDMPTVDRGVERVPGRGIGEVEEPEQQAGDDDRASSPERQSLTVRRARRAGPGCRRAQEQRDLGRARHQELGEERRDTRPFPPGSATIGANADLAASAPPITSAARMPRSRRVQPRATPSGRAAGASRPTVRPRASAGRTTPMPMKKTIG